MVEFGTSLWLHPTNAAQHSNNNAPLVGDDNMKRFSSPIQWPQATLDHEKFKRSIRAKI